MKFSAQFLSRAVAGLLLLACVANGGAAQAQSCQEDFQKLTERRMAQIQALNALGKAGKGKMDPTSACAVSKKLVGVEGEMAGYMTKNKEWCNIPDQVLEGFKTAAAKTKGFSAQACTAAAKMKQMMDQQREQAASGGGMGAPPKLPAGPL
jgi:hypothetical protein